MDLESVLERWARDWSTPWMGCQSSAHPCRLSFNRFKKWYSTFNNSLEKYCFDIASTLRGRSNWRYNKCHFGPKCVWKRAYLEMSHTLLCHFIHAGADAFISGYKNSSWMRTGGKKNKQKNPQQTTTIIFRKYSDVLYKGVKYWSDKAIQMKSIQFPSTLDKLHCHYFLQCYCLYIGGLFDGQIQGKLTFSFYRGIQHRYIKVLMIKHWVLIHINQSFKCGKQNWFIKDFWT